MSYLVYEILINGRLDLDGTVLDLLDNFGVLLNTVEQVECVDIGHDCQHCKRPLLLLHFKN